MDEKRNIKKYFLSINENADVTKGKYASLEKNFYETLKKYQSSKPIANYKIQPIQFTFEITTMCNCNCPNCGMSANKEKYSLTSEQIKFITDELTNFGIPGIAYTGGEPFLEFEKLCQNIKYSNDKIDTFKIISNGFWGKDPKYYFDKLIDAGLFNNRLLKPSIYISIGEQNVPLESICNLLHYVDINKYYEKINFGIINTRHVDEKNSKLEKMFHLYEINYKTFPSGKFYLTDSFYVNANKNAKEKIDIEKVQTKYIICECDNKFKQEIGKFVSPKIFMKCNGDCYPCEVFNYHKDVFLGNLFKDGIKNIIENYNSNDFILFINKYGTEGFCNVIPKDVLEKTNFETVCQACEFCIKYCKKNNLIKMQE